MKRKPIALVLLPLAAFALGWILHPLLSKSSSPPTEPGIASAPENAQRPAEAPPTEERPAAGAKNAPEARRQQGQAGAPNGPRAAAGGPERQRNGGAGGARGAGERAGGTAASSSGPSPSPSEPLEPEPAEAARPGATERSIELALTIVGAEKAPPPAGTRVRLVPSKPRPGIAEGLVKWASEDPQAFGSSTLVSERGTLVPEDGRALWRIPAGPILALEFWSETQAFEPGRLELGLSKAGRRRTVQVDLTRLAESEPESPPAPAAEASPAPSTSAPARVPTVPAEGGFEVADFHARVFGPSDEPVAGAKVRERGELVATADEEGRFQLLYDRAMAPVLEVSGPGIGPTIVQVRPGHESVEEELLVRLRPAAAISARLVNADGRPIPGVLVEVRTDIGRIAGQEAGFEPDANLPELGEISWSARTNQLGMVFLEGLPADAPLRIEGRRVGPRRNEAVGPTLPGIPSEVRLAPGEEWKGEWVVPRRQAIRGRAVDQSNEPVVGATIWLVRAAPGLGAVARYLSRADLPAATAVTGSDGSFRFEEPEPGLWLVGVGLPPVGAEPPWQVALDHLAQAVELPEPGGPELPELLLRIGRGLSLRGVVLDPEGKPMGGALVTALEDGGRGIAETRTDGEGNFTLGPLSRGSFRVLVAARAGAGMQTYGPIAAGSRELVLQLARSTPLVGLVVGADGSARAAGIALFQDGVQRARLRTREPERPGSFEAAGLAPGLYDFVAVTEDGQVGILRDARVGLEPQDGALRIPVSPGGRLIVRPDGSSSWRAFSLARDGRPFALGLLLPGIPSELSVPAGPLKLHLHARGDAPAVERSLDVPRGETIELDLAAPAASAPRPEAPRPLEASAERGREE